jgi:tetratricopeptide (TPR) repeat protein
VTVLTLSGLHPHAAAVLAETLTDQVTHIDDDVLTRLVERAGGNPLFLNELVANVGQVADADELPETLEGVILNRIDALPPEERSLLRRMSVFGGSFSHRIAAEVLGDALPPRGDRRWRRLEDFLDTSDVDRLTFRHTLLMDAAYRSLPYRVRESLHGAVGDALERTAGAVDDVAELLSQHFFHARRYDAAWRYSKVAAERAQAVFANSETARFYERALDAARHGVQVPGEVLFGVHEALGDTLKRLGRLADAERAYARARRLDPGSALAMSNLALKRAQVRQQSGEFVQALRWLRHAEEILADEVDTDVAKQRARIAVARASVAKDRGRAALIVRWCEMARMYAASCGDADIEAHASFLLDYGYVASGRRDLAVHSRRALQLFEDSGNLWGQGAVLNNMGAYAYWGGRWDEAVDLYTRARAILERLGDVTAAAVAIDNIGEIRSDQGHYEDAQQLLIQALDVRERVGDGSNLGFALNNLGRLRTRQGRFDEALALLTQARELSQSVGVSWDAVEAGVRSVECLLHMGDTDPATEMAFALLGDRASAPDRAQQGTLHRMLGYAYLHAGDMRAAADEFEVSLRDAREVGLAIEEAMTLRALGHLDVAAGRDPLLHFTQAQHRLDSLGVVAVAEPPWLTSVPAIPAQQGGSPIEPLQPSS